MSCVYLSVNTTFATSRYPISVELGTFLETMICLNTKRTAHWHFIAYCLLSYLRQSGLAGGSIMFATVGLF